MRCKIRREKFAVRDRPVPIRTISQVVKFRSTDVKIKSTEIKSIVPVVLRGCLYADYDICSFESAPLSHLRNRSCPCDVLGKVDDGMRASSECLSLDIII